VDVEEVEKTVPVRQEEIRLEREPITDATRSAVPDSEITEAEQTVTLHEEQPVVDTRVVPKERVRIRVDEHTEQRTVRGRVRKERIETDMTEAEAAAAEKDRREPGRGRPDDRYGGGGAALCLRSARCRYRCRYWWRSSGFAGHRGVMGPMRPDQPAEEAT
jgi:hypothetical protein